MNPQTIAIVVVAATLGLLLVLTFAYGRPRRSQQEALPPNFSKGDPDSVLEHSRLGRIGAWGLASAIFITGFFSVYWVIEPFRESQWDAKFLKESIDRGKHEYEVDAACNRCHGPDGGGGYASTDTTWPAPQLNNEFGRYTRAEIRRIVEQGRPGTPMPAWGIAFGGPLNDQRLDDVMNYLESIQTADKEGVFPPEMADTEMDGRKVYDTKCKDCHGPDARGQALGKPLPTFYAPDLTTSFYRLGLKVIQERLQAKDPALRVDDAKTQARARPMNEILTAGEEAARSTIEKGRPNTPMPAWKNRIGPKQIEAVVVYLRSIQRQPA